MEFYVTYLDKYQGDQYLIDLHTLHLSLPKTLIHTRHLIVIALKEFHGIAYVFPIKKKQNLHYV